jgi:prolyl 4-hydroxylase
LLFFPSFKDGTPDQRTLHKGEVALDEKMIAQVWVHERSYKASAPSDNFQADASAGIGALKDRVSTQ